MPGTTKDTKHTKEIARDDKFIHFRDHDRWARPSGALTTRLHRCSLEGLATTGLVPNGTRLCKTVLRTSRQRSNELPSPPVLRGRGAGDEGADPLTRFYPSPPAPL